MARPRFGVSFVLFFVLLAIPFGMLGVLVGFASAATTWGMPPSGAAATVLVFLAGVPLRSDSPAAWVLNGVCWGGALAFLIAFVRARFPQRPPREVRGFPVDTESPLSRRHESGTSAKGPPDPSAEPAEDAQRPRERPAQ
jgi:hypothetical protein